VPPQKERQHPQRILRTLLGRVKFLRERDKEGAGDHERQAFQARQSGNREEQEAAVENTVSL
jgi:hypothetical protein